MGGLTQKNSGVKIITTKFSLKAFLIATLTQLRANLMNQIFIPRCPLKVPRNPLKVPRNPLKVPRSTRHKVRKINY